MQKVLILKGLPASGKTTWARNLIDKYPGEYKRINKDDLRAMFDNSRWSKENEKFVLAARDWLIREALFAGKSVIVDDTNLDPKHKARIVELVAEHNKLLPELADGVMVEVNDSFLTTVSLNECIERDLKRANSVGAKVIKDMHRRYLQPPVTPYPITDGLPSAIICDIDGTLALFGDANPYDRDFTQDKVNMPVYEILNRESTDRAIILFSGRMDKYRAQTQEWLAIHGIRYDLLYMRKTDDVRKDFVIKKEIFDENIRGKCNVVFILDDRQQVVDMWRSLGLTCLQVADGDF